MAKSTSIIPIEQIASRIYLIRGQQVMLDVDLADLYDVPTGRLNEQVKRNLMRFPEDFVFQLTQDEAMALRSQFAILKGRGQHAKFLPRVFTEQGVAMLSSVLRSKKAAEVNVIIMRTFVKLRKVLGTNEELARKVAQHDQEIAVLFDEVRKLIAPPKSKKRRIGYIWPKDDE